MSNTSLVSSVEAAEILGKSKSQVVRMAADGALPVACKAPGLRGAYMFARADVETLAAAK